MAIHKLSARKVATAKPGKYEDGGGLRLVVSKTGSKRWVFRYTLHGRRREMGLGSWPDVSLADARDLALKSRRLVKDQIDPIEARRLKRRRIPDFTSCAALFIRAHRHGWRNRKHARQWISTLKTYARPVIGNKPVNAVSTEDVLAILSPIWKTRTETAKRVQGRLENILDFAAARKWRDSPNPARWRGHLDKLLPRPSQVKKVKHYPAMPWQEVPAFMTELRTKESIAPKALQFLILTAARTKEVLHARWEEIDLAQSIWIIPEERMKMGKEHRVPLPKAATELLRSLPREAGNPYVFPGSRPGKPLSKMSLRQALRRMGYGSNCEKGPYVPHGFRSSFRDWAGEVSIFPRDVVEMALAHVIKNKTEAAYRRGDLLIKRRKLMDAWAEYIIERVPVP